MNNAEFLVNGFSIRVSGEDLIAGMVHTHKTRTETDCINWMRQVCQGVSHMHKNNIIHLDLRVSRSTLPVTLFCIAVYT